MTMTASPGPMGPPPMMLADGLGFAAALEDGQPALIFDFSVPPGHPRLPTIKCVIPGDDMAKIPDLVANAVAKVLEASGYTPRQEAVCSGPCGRKLFGEMAERGICKECAPDDKLPLDEQPVDEQIEAAKEAADLAAEHAPDGP